MSEAVKVPSVADALPCASVLLPAVPTALRKQTTWLTWMPMWNNKKSKYLKVSTHSNNPKSHLTFKAASNKSEYLAMYMHEDSALICIDIDSPDDDDINSFVKKYPTFEEHSPSGPTAQKRHAWYLLPNNDPTPKREKSLPSKPTRHSGKTELYCYKHYITVTGHVTDTSLKQVKTLTLEAYQELLMLFPAKKAPIDIQTKQPLLNHTQSKSLPDINLWLATVPSDFGHLVRIRCEQMGWSHYDYWITGLQALHYYFDGRIEGLKYADEWSKKDEEKYVDSDDVATHWMSFTTERDEAITERTYMQFFKWFQIDWPHKAKDKPPSPTSYKNFIALLAHFDLTIKIDAVTLIPFIDGPDSFIFPRFYDDVIEQYSYQNNYETIASKLFIFSQDFYLPSLNTIQSHVKAFCQDLRIRDFHNPFKEWVDGVKWDGESRLPELYDCYDINNDYTPITLAHKFMRRWLFSVIRSFYLKELPPSYRMTTAEGVLIVSGPEATNKTTSFRLLLPHELERYYVSAPVTLDGQSGEKDSLLRSVGRLISVMDEIEIVFDGNRESRFKEFITRSSDSFRPPYAAKNQDFPRICSFAGTTNHPKLRIPDEGARRYWMFVVRNIDTERMMKIDLQQLWAEVKALLFEEAKKSKSPKAPWVLSKDELNSQRINVQQFRATSNVEDILQDVFQWDYLTPEYIRKISRSNSWMTNTMSIKEICVAADIPRTKAIKYSIERILRGLNLKTYTTKQGNPIIDGYYKYRGQDRYLVPPKRSEFAEFISNGNME